MGHFHRSCLLLIVFYVASSAAKPVARPMFEEWLNQRAVAAVAASAKPASKNYDELETEFACLSILGNRNCRCIGCTDYCAEYNPGSWAWGDCDNPACCSKIHIEPYFTCCKQQLQDYYGYKQESPHVPAALANYEIGDCEISASGYQLVPYEQKKGTFKVGTYTAKCAVKQGGEHCGHPFCDSLILTSYGTIHIVVDAIANSSPADPSNEASCTTAVGRWLIGIAGYPDILMNTTRDAKRSQANSNSPLDKVVRDRILKAVKSKAAPKAAEPEASVVDGFFEEVDPTLKWYKSIALVFSGPLHLTSRQFDVKYREGTFEYAAWQENETAEPISATEAAGLLAQGAYKVTPDTFVLKLTKPHGSYDERAV